MQSHLVQIQCQRNAVTKNDGTSYATHRGNVMRLIEATASELAVPNDSACERIALLGAGNCLDVDLPRLAELFRGVHLIDIDAAAISDAARRESGDCASVIQHAPVDIAAPLMSLTAEDFRTTGGSTEEVAGLLQRLSSDEIRAGIPPRSCDAAASLCVLTQLIGSLTEIIGEQHPLFAAAVKAIRVGHLRRMLNLLRPGGIAILVTDIVSSDTAPQLARTQDAQLGPLIRELVNDRNFFTGVNPAVVLSELNMLERLPHGADTAQVFDPWQWQMGPRVFAVYAIRFQAKRPGSASEDQARFDFA
ncbi:MAG: hypothetical protein R3C19_09480 [Planctomycetaceae bacterium]